MRLRRLTGALLTLLTLHLNLLGADFACVRHVGTEGETGHGSAQHAMPMEGTAAATAHGAGAHDVMAHDTETHAAPTAQDAATVVSSDTPPCDVPVQPNCCKALASCNVVFSTGSELDVAGLFNLSEQIAPYAMTAPPSERAAPEPPPPKA